MRKKFIALGLAISGLVSAQTNIAYYKYANSLNTKEGLPEATREIVEEIIAGEQDVQIKLLFNDKEAVAQANVADINSENYTAFMFCNCTSAIFFNKTINQIKFYNEDMSIAGVPANTYVLTKPLKADWKLINETKEIDGFSAYKAEMQELDGDKYRTVTAWYVPELPYPYGPTRYGGLPGLIVQLEVGSSLYTLAKIERNKKIDMPQPPVGEEKDAETFDQETYQIMNRGRIKSK